MSEGDPGPPAGALTLGAREVHVWRLETDRLLPRAAEWGELLSPDERERAARLRRPADRELFAARRGACRILLARYAGAAPGSLRFAHGPHGQPSLVSPGISSSPRFSVSHTDGLILLAVVREGAVGVDVERVRELPDMRRVARHLFSAREKQELEEVPRPALAAAFFRCWTRKEAFVKAIGAGTTFPLDAFDVSITEPARLYEVRSTDHRAGEWSLHHLALREPYVGALAVESRDAVVVPREWPG